MTDSLSIDFETRATVDLKKTGVYPYAKHHHTDIWCMAWAFNEEEPEIWTPTDRLPFRILAHIVSGNPIRAHNAQFERVLWNEIMVPRYGAPEVKLEQWWCSAAEAAAMALPRSLDQAAKVTGVAAEKDQDGYALMLRMTRPRSWNGDEPVWWDVEERKQRLYEYCKQDVRVERALSKVLRRLTPDEREVYLFDQRINDRGIQIDRPLIIAAQKIADEAVSRANDVIIELTGGEVSKVSQNGRALAWVQAQGVQTDSLDKAAVRDLLESDLDPNVRAFIEERAESGRTSIAKLKAMLACACEDDRMRGLLLYHGASTGRWSGRLAQPHNFARGGELENIESYIDDVLAGRYDTIDVMAPPVLVIVEMLRSMLVSAPGHDLIAADFSAIEARVLNWLAGQEDILQLFREGKDVYKYNAARLYKIAIEEVLKFPHRQTGKFQELGCGFQMGYKKAVSAAKKVYGLTITEDEAKEIVTQYRETHDKVVAFWGGSNEATIEAVSKPGKPVRFGALKNLAAVKAGGYLYIVLPNKRPLCYAQPKIVERETPWGAMAPAVEVSAQNPLTRRWERTSLYGGLIVENIVQAVARDLLVHGMMEAEKAGYTAILSVHDEAVAEVPEGFGSVEEFERILATTPTWAVGCPVSAEGWRGKRYRK